MDCIGLTRVAKVAHVPARLPARGASPCRLLPPRSRLRPGGCVFRRRSRWRVVRHPFARSAPNRSLPDSAPGASSRRSCASPLPPPPPPPPPPPGLRAGVVRGVDGDGLFAGALARDARGGPPEPRALPSRRLGPAPPPGARLRRFRASPRDRAPARRARVPRRVAQLWDPRGGVLDPRVRPRHARADAEARGGDRGVPPASEEPRRRRPAPPRHRRRRRRRSPRSSASPWTPRRGPRRAPPPPPRAPLPPPPRARARASRSRTSSRKRRPGANSRNPSAEEERSARTTTSRTGTRSSFS